KPHPIRIVGFFFAVGIRFLPLITATMKVRPPPAHAGDQRRAAARTAGHVEDLARIKANAFAVARGCGVIAYGVGREMTAIGMPHGVYSTEVDQAAGGSSGNSGRRCLARSVRRRRCNSHSGVQPRRRRYSTRMPLMAWHTEQRPSVVADGRCSQWTQRG